MCQCKNDLCKSFLKLIFLIKISKMILKNSQNPNLAYRKLRPKQDISTEIKTSSRPQLPPSSRLPHTTTAQNSRSSIFPSLNSQNSTPRHSNSSHPFSNRRLKNSNSQKAIQPSLLPYSQTQQFPSKQRRVSHRKKSLGNHTQEKIQKSASYSSFPHKKKSGRRKERKLEEVVTQQPAQVLDFESSYNEHLVSTLQALRFLKTLPAADPGQLRTKMLTLPWRPGYKYKKSIIFDLDETLVHCCNLSEQETADVKIPVTFPGGEIIEAGINIRPHTLECLQAANRNFEVIVFTASHQCYADAVLDYLDPNKALIHHRLYRDSCIITNGLFIKDLRVIGNRKMKDMAIVDNSVYSFGYQINNGVPIISWYSDKGDVELLSIIQYMERLVEARDVRELNAEMFNLSSFMEKLDQVV